MIRLDNIKMHRLLCAAIFIILTFVLFGFNSYNVDRDNYIELYQREANNPSSDAWVGIGFGILMFLANKIGLNYDGFQIVLSILVIGIITHIFIKHSSKAGYLFFLYIIFPFILDTIQIRNTVSYLFVTLAILQLEGYNSSNKKAKRKKIFLFFVYEMMAVSFHILAIIYFFYLLAIKKQNLKIIVLIIVAFELVGTVLAPNLIMSVLRVQGKVELLFAQGGFHTTTVTKILMLFFVAIFPSFFYIVDRNMSEHNNQLFSLTRRISEMSVVLYPILILDVDFFRIYRNLIILLEIGLVSGIKKIRPSTTRATAYIILIILQILLCYAFICFHSNNLSYIINNNSLWK